MTCSRLFEPREKYDRRLRIKSCIRCGHLVQAIGEFERHGYLLYRDYQRVFLRPINMKTVWVLLLNLGKQVSIDDLIQEIYPDPWNAPQNERNSVSKNVCESYRELRKLGVKIEATMRRGYWLEL